MSDELSPSDAFDEASGRRGSQDTVKSYPLRRIDELMAQRRSGEHLPAPAPGGFFRSEALSTEDRAFNRAIDAQVAFWREVEQKRVEARGIAKESFGKAKMKDRARSDFDQCR